MSPTTPEPLYFLGIRFWNGETDQLLREMDRSGGMLAVPSAPSLGQAYKDPLLIKAYQTADWSVVDGGYVALIIRAMGRSVRRISGLQLIEKLIACREKSPVPMRERKILWVVPDEAEEIRIAKLLVTEGFDAGKQTYYRAPYYGTDEDFHDRALAARAVEEQPNWIVLCLGGGRQEKLGYHLRRDCRKAQYNPVILCTGAAIAFFSGGQVSIPTWADRMYLGWLLRILEKPGVYLPRYFNAAWHMPAALWHFRGQWFGPCQPEAGDESSFVPVVRGKFRHTDDP